MSGGTKWAMPCAFVLVATACADQSEPSTMTTTTGTATITLTQAPPDVGCLRVVVEGSRTVERRLEITRGESTVFTLQGLPLGVDRFTGYAYSTECAMVQNDSIAAWVADPVSATVRLGTPTSVSLVMHRNGQASVSIDFADDGEGSVDVTCRTILAGGGANGDGIYALRVAGRSFDGYCLMTQEGGGWTLVASYPPPPSAPAIPPGWSTGEQVGSAFTDSAALFKMADSLINAVKTTTYRVHGVATQCLQGPCALDVTVYWSGACTYSSTSTSPACSTAYFDASLSEPTPSTRAGPRPCVQHWGLVDAVCGDFGAMITSHDPSYGISVSVGDPSSYVHSGRGRGIEDASMQIWVR